MTENEVIQVLLVEDNEGDVLLVNEAFSSYSQRFELVSVSDGDQALMYLKKAGEYANAPTPDIILLDMNLPKRDGRQLLTSIKSDDELKVIPTLVMTSSRAAQDIKKSYELCANAYIIKPSSLTQFEALVKGIELFWANIAQLPTKYR